MRVNRLPACTLTCAARQQEVTNMTRINLFHNMPVRKTADENAASAAGSVRAKNNLENTGALVFGALLIICSLAIGCSNDKPKSASSSNLSSGIQNSNTPMPASSSVPAGPVASEPKPAPKKVVKKRPATVKYVDQGSGISFEYPRRYAIEAGAAATDLVDSNSVPTNFVAPGGTVLVAVELPETGFANTDFSSAFFGVSVNKSLSAEDCGKFAVPQAGDANAAPISQPSTPVQADAAASTAAQAAPEQAVAGNATVSETKSESNKRDSEAASEKKTDAPFNASQTDTAASSIKPAPKVMLSDMDMQKTEAVSGEGNRQSDSKFYHVYQNNACYEFALNVTTLASQSDGDMKHIDRDKVFAKLERILATVKINPVETEKEAITAPSPVPAQ
jgi:hypothetical protein